MCLCVCLSVRGREWWCSKIRILSNNFVVIPKMNIFSIEISLGHHAMMIPYLWNGMTGVVRDGGGGAIEKKGLENGKNDGFKQNATTNHLLPHTTRHHFSKLGINDHLVKSSIYMGNLD